MGSVHRSLTALVTQFRLKIRRQLSTSLSVLSLGVEGSWESTVALLMALQTAICNQILRGMLLTTVHRNHFFVLHLLLLETLRFVTGTHPDSVLVVHDGVL